MIRDATIKYLTTASSRINCLRCTAKSSCTKQQYGKPALKSSKTQKCGHHGGLSTCPKTAEGRQRIAVAICVMAVWRRSWKCKSGNLALATALSKLAAKAQAVMGKTAPEMLRGIAARVWIALVDSGTTRLSPFLVMCRVAVLRSRLISPNARPAVHCGAYPSRAQGQPQTASRRYACWLVEARQAVAHVRLKLNPALAPWAGLARVPVPPDCLHACPTCARD
jgi:hypothetical protein